MMGLKRYTQPSLALPALVWYTKFSENNNLRHSPKTKTWLT